MSDHFVAEIHNHGFSIDDVIEHLEKRRRK